MKREIKFRAWNGKSMYRIEGLRWILFGSPEEGKGIRVDENGQNDWETLQLDDKKCVLMQFTGLLDKNGKEIYEGDIIRQKDYNSQIVWLDDYACFALIEIGGTKPYTLYEQFSYAKPEVVGNIYENPELISK